MGNISEKIIQLRDRFKLTPAELAMKADLDPSYISKLENGVYKSLSLKVSKSLARGFGLTLRDFMEEMGLFPDTSQPSYDLITSALRRNKFSNEQIKQIIDYARFIKKRD